MKNIHVFSVVAMIAAIFFFTGCDSFDNPVQENNFDGDFEGPMVKGKKDKCTTIQSGELYTSDEEVIKPGFDKFGYNYQARIFNGRYCDYNRVIGGDDCDVHLIMKWNDAWLSNQDCDGDGKLDRHYGFDSYIGSGAWITNHMKGDGWTYFVKIVAVPKDANLVGSIWYTAGGTEIGPVIWGQFAIIQEVLSGEGAIYVSPAGPGLGKW